MNSPRWPNHFPRLYELCLLDASNPNNYFNDSRLQAVSQEDPPNAHLVELEQILGQFDSIAWADFKSRTKPSLSTKDKFGYHTQLFECFNEARAYVYLKNQGCTQISFIQAVVKRGQRAPDLTAKDRSGKQIVLEAKRVRESDDENEYLLEPVPHDVQEVVHGLTDAMKAKLTSTVERAKKQLLAFPDSSIAHRILFLSVRIDLQNATRKTRQELTSFIDDLCDDQIEVVVQIENSFLL